MSTISYKVKMLENTDIINIQKNELDKQHELISKLTCLYNETIEFDRQKTEFFTNITHELKTPLSVILGAVQLMEKRNAGHCLTAAYDSKQLKIIKINCFRLLRLINNILDISRVDSGHVKINFVNCNIVYLIEEMVQSIIPFADQKGVLLQFDTEEEEIITAVDIDKMERIILNLLSNAIKFTKSGGSVLVYVKIKNNTVIISVKDTGPGIPREKQTEIFERFHQVNSSLTREQEGSGIGLSIVKSFVELHNGSVRLNSEENKGSEFIVEIPVRLCEENRMGNTTAENMQNKIINTFNIEFSDIYTLGSTCEYLTADSK